jgi:hypothetical protein
VEVGGEHAGVARTCHRDPALLQNLTQGLQRAALEFREFIEKEDPTVGERDFSRNRRISTPQKSRSRCAVVWGTKRTFHAQTLLHEIVVCDAVDERGLECFVKGQRGQQRWQPTRQHGLSRTGGATQEQAVAAGCGDLQRALGVLLSVDVAEARFRACSEIAGHGPGVRKWFRSEEVRNDRAQGLRRTHLDPRCECGRGSVGSGNDRPLAAAAARCHDTCEGPTYWTDSTIEGEFPE